MLGVFEKRVLSKIFAPKKAEVIGYWRRLHSEGFHDLYCLPNAVWVIRSRRM
jgi:hypothetical protein